MEMMLVVIVIAITIARWVIVRDRLKRMDATIASLTERIWKLEYPAQPIRSEPSAEPRPVPVPVPAIIPTQPPPSKVPERAPIEPAPVPIPISFGAERAVAVPTLTDRVHKHFGDPGWELLVGGSLLNKVGALVLVIGLALFLAYSFTNMSPGGRAMTCVATSWTLLLAGVFVERKPAYKVFARGLIGAGWAALYVTAYAIYAVPAARLIQNAYFGSVLLLIVAAGMIGHSLLYRKQAVTAVAYFAAFAALSVTPWSTFGFVGLLPLTASLLWIALRMEWNAMAIFGVIALYGSCIWRGSSEASLLGSQALLLVYWLMFEGFDLLRVHLRKTGSGVEYVFPINAVAFLSLSYHAWLTKDPSELWKGCAFGAVLFLGSAIARRLMRPEPVTGGLAAHMREGNFQLPVTISAVLTGAAIAIRAVGVWLSAGLAIEAELLYLAGVGLNSAVLRALGRMGFTGSLLRLIFHDIPAEEVLQGSLPGIHPWTPVALFHACLFYVNRALRKPNALMSSIAAGLIAGVLWQVLPERFIGTAWLVFALLLFEIGLRYGREFRFQAYALAAAGVLLDIGFQVINRWTHPWIPLAFGLALLYALFFRARMKDRLSETEGKRFEIAISGVITCLAMLICWYVLPVNYRALGLVATSLVLLELGKVGIPASLQYFSRVAVCIAAVLVITTQASVFGLRPAPLHVWATYAGTTLLLYAFSERGREWAVTHAGISVISAAFALCTLKLLVPENWLAVCWGAAALLLFVSGVKRNRSWERVEGYVAIIAAFLAACVTDFPWQSFGIAAACYVAEFLSSRDNPELEPRARAFWSVAGTVTLTSLLWQKFPGGLLTTAWGIEGILLLAAGFLFTERILRMQGLVMLLACILKVFLYDLRNLETGYRILSFVGLGLILLAVSSIYSRFRDQIRKHL